MENKWSDARASESISRWAGDWGEDLALRTYTSRLLGSEPNLVLHGGGNTSVKSTYINVLGEKIAAVFVKASGQDMACIEPVGHPGLDLDYLLRLRALPDLSDDVMLSEFRTHLFDSQSPTPSIETLMHAFIPVKFVEHTHADAVLALTNQQNGEQIVREALGDNVIFIGYVKAGFKLAKAAADAFDKNPNAEGIVLSHHGLVTWGDTARESYDKMIELVTRAEDYLEKHTSTILNIASNTSLDEAHQRFVMAAPVLRGILSLQDQRFILQPLITREVLDFVDSNYGRELALTPPLTPDHLIRTKILPLWVDSPDYDDPAHLKEQLAAAVEQYKTEYEAYLERHIEEMPPGLSRFDSLPRIVMMPGVGAVCAGKDAESAAIASDITAQTISVKMKIAAMGNYHGLSEDDLFKMEYHLTQHAKTVRSTKLPLSDRVAFVTGAAGAIGSGICRGLLSQGCHVAVTDLPGQALDTLVDELRQTFGRRVMGVPMDVTEQGSVRSGLEAIVETWGGVDIAVVNAGIAMVSSLAEMDLEAFRRLERVNIEGTLLVIREAAGLFEVQGIGGDIILISTKNVFSPGARFGAYSATKAASHQLARIASLELAEMDVRVNMVAPDAVFSDGVRKSGLWQEVGPDRMKARGLDEKGLEEYYRSRNLLKAQVTADHVANAVLFFATRQTPTTGATIPVDGGLPDATPR